MTDRDLEEFPEESGATSDSRSRRGTMYQRAEWRQDAAPAVVARPTEQQQAPGRAQPRASVTAAAAPKSARHRQSMLAMAAAFLIAGIVPVAWVLWPTPGPVPGRTAPTRPAASAPPPVAAAPRESRPDPVERTPAVSRGAAASAIPETRPREAIAGARIAAAVAPAAAAPAAPRASAGELRVTSNPPGARVTVNGLGWGVTPLTVRNLPLGAQTVRLTHDGYLSRQQVVQVTAEQPVASLSVTLRPATQPAARPSAQP